MRTAQLCPERGLGREFPARLTRCGRRRRRSQGRLSRRVPRASSSSEGNNWGMRSSYWKDFVVVVVGGDETGRKMETSSSVLSEVFFGVFSDMLEECY